MNRNDIVLIKKDFPIGPKENQGRRVILLNNYQNLPNVWWVVATNDPPLTRTGPKNPRMPLAVAYNEVMLEYEPLPVERQSQPERVAAKTQNC